MTMTLVDKIRMLTGRWPGLLAAPMVLLLVVGAVVVSPQAAAAPALDFQALLTQAAPAVGVVRATTGRRSISGTAFVIDSQGWLLTAAHVARRAQQLQVVLPGMAPMDASVVGYDATRDLAVLRVTPTSPLPALEFSDGSLSAGEAVAVIGAPRGRPSVITTGEVLDTRASVPGLARDILVRISAVVRPGTSGGPLLNSRAQVVGVVVASAFDRSRSRGALAVSAEAIRAVLPQLRQGARVERAWIGIAAGPVGRGRDRRPDATADQGAVVREIMTQSPAAAAGLQPGDVVVEFEGMPIRNWRELLDAVGQRRPGERVRLVVLRDGNRIDITVTLGVRP